MATAASALLVSVLFFLRVFLFLYTPLTQSQLSGSASTALYPHFFYTLPELVPLVLLIDLAMPGGIVKLRTWYVRSSAIGAVQPVR
jgi:hypothetical protein